MLSGRLDIWNMAISHLGESIEINGEDENTAAARACRRFWDVCREKALRDAPWPFAKKYALLAQLTSAIPTTEFRYAYRVPSDSVMARRVLNGVTRVESMQSRVPFQIARDDEGEVLYCDVTPRAGTTADTSGPWLQYTFNETDVSRFHADFAMAISYLLARSIAPRIAGDKTKTMDACVALYERELAKATIAALNEEARDDQVPSEFERARDGWVQSSPDGRADSTFFPSSFIISS